NHLRAGQPVPRPAVRGASRRSRTRALSMTSWSVFEAAATAAVARLGAAHLRALAASIAAGLPDEVTAHAVPVPGFAEVARAVLRAQRQAGLSDAEAAAYLRGVAAGHAQRSAAVRVESVWSGPATHR